MSAAAATGSRLGAYLRFLAAVLYFFVARALAARATQSLLHPEWASVAEQLVLIFLLVAGYSSMGFWFDKQMRPMSEQGLPMRQDWGREAGLGIALGWGLAAVPVLAMALIGGIATSVSLQLGNFGWLAVDLLYFALAALAEEIAFRGYGFQCFERAVGGLGAALIYAAMYAILLAAIPGSSRASVLVGVFLTLLLSAAYVRTRALWVSWGINFAWKASRALLFGLAVMGVNSRSPIVQGNPMGPFWLTGGSFGLDASWFTVFVLLAALPVVFRATEELAERFNQPVVVPGGIPVDIEASVGAQRAQTTGPVQPELVQIQAAAANSPNQSANSSATPPAQNGQTEV